ncbi:MAG: HD domain-containing protein [Clostridia bacterium]
MVNKIINDLKKEVYARAIKPENKFGIGCYYHIEAVVKNAEILADYYNADKEVVVIAAWLHDIASITDYQLYENHHIHGANIAETILKKYNYDTTKIDLIKKCILNHRGSISNERLTMEEKCVADADGISHFDSIPSLLYLAYVKNNLEIEEGKNFVKNKLERSYKKLSDDSKKFYLKKYQNAMNLLG